MRSIHCCRVVYFSFWFTVMVWTCHLSLLHRVTLHKIFAWNDVIGILTVETSFSALHSEEWITFRTAKGTIDVITCRYSSISRSAVRVLACIAVYCCYYRDIVCICSSVGPGFIILFCVLHRIRLTCFWKDGKELISHRSVMFDVSCLRRVNAKVY